MSKKITAEETVVPAVASKKLFVIMLPPQRGLPIGHLLRVATEGENVLWSKESPTSDTVSMNQEYNSIIETGKNKGYEVLHFISADVSYKKVMDIFPKEPLTAISTILNPKSESSEAF